MVLTVPSFGATPADKRAGSPKFRDGQSFSQDGNVPASGAKDWVHRAAFAPDGQTLASGGCEGPMIVWDLDGKVNLWNVSGLTGR
jgi:WD40 repeat protein